MLCTRYKLDEKGLGVWEQKLDKGDTTWKANTEASDLQRSGKRFLSVSSKSLPFL